MKLLRTVVWLSCLCGSAFGVRAEVLPVRSYTTGDGLVSNFVQRIRRDSHGFLWFCTRGGLSRFDGRMFKNYTTADGLPNPTVNDILETRAGDYWVATNGGGVMRFPASRPLTDRDGSPNFTLMAVGEASLTNRVNGLYEDRAGRIWAATDGGLFRFEADGGQGGFRFVPLEPAARPASEYGMSAFAEDLAGNLWTVARARGVIRLRPDGGVETYSRGQVGMRESFDISILADRSGRIWLAGFDRLCRLVTAPQPGASLVERCFPISEARADNMVSSLYESAKGHLLITTMHELWEFDGEALRLYDLASFSTKLALSSAIEDIAGNIWLGSTANGAVKLLRKGFTHFDETSQSPTLFGIVALAEDRAGHVMADSGNGRLLRFNGSGFDVIPPRLSSDTNFIWLANTVFEDRTGQLWVLAAGKGLLRFRPGPPAQRPALDRPAAIYNRDHGLGDVPFRIYEDRRSDLWVSIMDDQERDRLRRWRRQTGRFERFTVGEGLPPYNSPYAFAEDLAGNLWIGFYEGGVGRLRNGRFEWLDAGAGFSDRMITDLYLDRQGRMWVCSNSRGVLRVDEPAGDRLVVSARYQAADGLASDDVRSIVDDNWGRVYIGTIRGIDRLDVGSGNLTHFGPNDGLPNDFMLSAFRDRRGDLWFGTFQGVARLAPELEDLRQEPDVFITGLSVAGVARPVAEVGERQIDGLVFSPTGNNIQVDFGAISFAFGESLRFRYRLEGTGELWSAPTADRSVNLSLAPGAYRFVVQAVSANGGPLSDKLAVVSFQIRPPLWQRRGFQAAVAALLLALAYALYHYRLARLLEVERVRTRIASDLHDDIGASLSQIAVVSEVLQRQVNTDDARIGKNLRLMARVSREAVDAMSDIVWAIDPHRDQLQDLIRRMRRFASETLPSRNIELDFRAPDRPPGVKLGADFRRESFLVFKESVNNVLKHSGASRVEIALRLDNHTLVLRVSDNGKGFAPEGQPEGNGLRNMRRRSAALGGRCEIVSGGGSGTTVCLRVPLRHKPT